VAKALFTGDLIFKEGFGRTDLPGGDSATLKESIKRMADLEVELLLSGHGDIIAGNNKTQIPNLFPPLWNDERRV